MTQARFDFAQFDAETADLHLLVQTTQVVDYAVFALAHQIAGAVHAPALGIERVRHKALGTQTGLVMIATRQTLTAQVQLAADTHRQRVHVRIQHVHTAPGHAAANRRVGGVTLLRHLGAPQQRRDHCFCRAVAIDQTLRLQGAFNQFKAGIRHRIAAKAVGVHRWRRPLGQRHFGQLLQISRREARHIHLLLMQHLQGLLGGPQVVAANHQAATGQQHTEPAFLRTVERERHKVQFTARRAQLIQLDNSLAMPRNRLAGHRHAFGLAGGARGVDQIRQVPGQWLHGVRRALNVRQCVQLQPRQGRIKRHPLIDVAAAQQQARARVRQHKGQTLSRVIQVQRQERCPRLEHRQKRHDSVLRARQRHGHHLLRADASGLQLARQPIGLTLKLGITEFAAVTAQRPGLRLAQHLLAKALHQISHRQSGLRRFDTGVGQADVTDQTLGVLRQLCQQPFQLRTNALDLRRTEALAQVQVFHLQALLAGADHQVHREVGHPAAADFGKAQLAVLLAAQGAVYRVVLKHDDAVEQPLPALPGPALNICQRRVFKVADRQVVVLHLTQPVAQRLLRVEGLDHRQGVDKQPEHVLRPGQLRRSPGHGGAKGHAALPGVTLQEQQPGPLNQCVKGDALGIGKAMQTLGRRAVQIAVQHAMPAALSIRGLGQNARRVQRLQALAPEVFGLRGVLALQPVDVVGITPGQRWQRLPGVHAEHLTEQARGAPAVEQQVMVSPDHLHPGLAHLHQGEAHQRRAVEVKTTGLFILGQRLQGGFGRCMLAPVQLDNRQFGMPIHRLHRFGHAVTPAERSAQHLMACEQGLPRGAKALHLQAFNRHAQLVDVQIKLGRLDAMEQHALLHRRQRVNIVQLIAINRQRAGRKGKRRSVEGFKPLRLGSLRHCRQRTDGLCGEQLLGGKGQPTGPGTAHRLQRDDRITAQLEEVLGDANRLQPQQLLPDLNQQHLGRSAWRDTLSHLPTGLR